MSFISYDNFDNQITVQPLMKVILSGVPNPIPNSRIVYTLKNNTKYVYMFSFMIIPTTNININDYIDTLPIMNLNINESLDAVNNANSILVNQEALYDKRKELENIDPLPTTSTTIAPTTSITSTTETASTTIGSSTEQPITSEPP